MTMISFFFHVNGNKFENNSYVQTSLVAVHCLQTIPNQEYFSQLVCCDCEPLSLTTL